MPTAAEEIRAAVGQRFAQVARSPEQERRFRYKMLPGVW